MSAYLVTGGAGFIGSHLATRLVENGHSVRVLDNLSTGSINNLSHIEGQYEMLTGDVCDQSVVAQAVDNVDVVFHLAALPSVSFSLNNPLKTHHASVTGTITLLDACRKSDVKRLVYAASSSAYGDRHQTSNKETDLPKPLSPYAAAKLSCEMYCEAFANAYDLETVRLRYFNVFGPRQHASSRYSAVIPMFIAALMEDKNPVIYGDGTQSRDFTYIDNVVHANILAADAKNVSGNVYNAACGKSTDLLQLLSHICRLLDRPCQPQFMPERIGDIKHSLADISAAEADLGYRVQISVEQGIQSTVEWYLKNQHLAHPTIRASA